MEIVYPVSRLLSNPRVFYAIANYLGGPDAETLRDAFYSLLEFEFDDFESPYDCEFDAEEVCFSVKDDGETCDIILDTGLMSHLESVKGEVKAQINDDKDLVTTSAIYKKLVSAIEEANPDLKGDVALCSPPTPGNSYLKTPDGNNFEGSFHLLSNPEEQFAFKVAVLDPESEELQAFIKPIV
jgi:hypothetical protein